MYTEEEAKKKWCPVRAKINAMRNVFPVISEDQIDNCLGSDCIEWQGLSVISILNAIPYNDLDAHAIRRFKEKATKMVDKGEFKSLGYCGVKYGTE